MLKSTFLSLFAFLLGGFFFASIISSSSDNKTEPTTSSEIAVGQDAFIGEIMVAGFNFCPRNYMACEGQILPINNNQALFSLLGTTYGGDGRTTFALPDLRGRSAVGAGQGVGLPLVRLGQSGGTENVSAPKRITKLLPNNPNLGLKYCICTQGIFPSRS